MDISKHDFVEKFPEIADAILEADCIAIDAEFSGIYRYIVHIYLFDMDLSSVRNNTF